jgi:hypothetical protein
MSSINNKVLYALSVQVGSQSTGSTVGVVSAGQAVI